MKYGSDQFYVRPPEEMYRLFPGQEEAVKRSQEIANKCDIQLDFKKRHFPVFRRRLKPSAARAQSRRARGAKVAMEASICASYARSACWNR